MMASIRSELNLLDAKISEFQQLAEFAADELEPIALEPIEFLDIIDTDVEVQETVVEEETVVDEPVIEPEPEMEPEAELEFVAEPVEQSAEEPVEQPAEQPAEESAEFLAEEPVEEPVEDLVEEPVEEASAAVVDDLPADDDDDLPFFDEPEVVTETVPEPTKEAIQVVVPESVPIIDTMIDRQAWRTDMPGGVVRDVRSAISLNDRILFINKLFDEDPLAFQTAIGKINSMVTLAEVVEYINTEHSDWNLESDTVYRFMMAVRRKVR